MAVCIGWVSPAQASEADNAAIQQELAAMRAQMAQMAARIDTLEGQLATAQARVAEAQAKADAATTSTAALAAQAAPTATAKPDTTITWDGAPKLATKSGWSFKPRGRMQVDVASFNPPSSVSTNDKGIATEFRRVYFGFDGTIPGNFGYRVEADIANSSIQLTDVYLTYKPTPKLTLTLGHQKPFWGMEEMTSDLFTSFMERAAYSSTFGFERRVGLSAAYSGKQVVLQAGVFTDDASSLNTSTNNSYSLDGRVVFMPKIGDAQLHVGGSIHYRRFNDLTSNANYRARPFVHTTDTRLINTGTIANAVGERGLGAELAYINGRFHASAEGFWQKTLRSGGLFEPSFNGGYAEVGYMLTKDKTSYKGGTYDRTRPNHPVGKDGIGAVQVNLRYDWLDLNSGPIIGGRQEIAAVSLVWNPTDYVRFLLNYGHMWLRDAAVPAGASRNYNADAMGVRAQFDF